MPGPILTKQMLSNIMCAFRAAMAKTGKRRWYIKVVVRRRPEDALGSSAAARALYNSTPMLPHHGEEVEPPDIHRAGSAPGKPKSNRPASKNIPRKIR